MTIIYVFIRWILLIEELNCTHLPENISFLVRNLIFHPLMSFGIDALDVFPHLRTIMKLNEP